MHNFNKDDLKKAVGKRVAFKRKELKLSQERLAEQLGIESRALSKIENGHVFISPNVLTRLCDLWKLSPAFFFDIDVNDNIDTIKLKEINSRLSSCSKEKFNLYYRVISAIDSDDYEQEI